jgi:hypothetical protein
MQKGVIYNVLSWPESLVTNACQPHFFWRCSEFLKPNSLGPESEWRGHFGDTASLLTWLLSPQRLLPTENNNEVIFVNSQTLALFTPVLLLTTP